MKRTIFSFILLFAVAVPVLMADAICDDLMAEGKQKYNAGQYEKAKSLFQAVIEQCGYNSAREWLAKCNDALAPTTLSVSRTNVSVGAAAGSTTVTVNCNRAWSLKNTSSSIFSVSRNGNTLTIYYYANPNTTARSDCFDVASSDGSCSRRIIVKQSAKSTQTPTAAQRAKMKANFLNLNKTSISATSSGATEYINISSSGEWEIQYPNPTSDIYSVTRLSNTQIRVVVNRNTTSSSRTDYFNIKLKDGSKVVKVSISQTAALSSNASRSSSSSNSSSSRSSSSSYNSSSSNYFGYYPSFYVERIRYNVSAAGGYYDIGIYGDRSVSLSRAWTNKNWLEEESIESGIYYFHVKPNPSSTSRCGELYITDTRGRKITIYVCQEGKR